MSTPPNSDGPAAATGSTPCRWPAEWAPHRATWMTWPHNPETWPGAFERVPNAYAQLVRTIAAFEPIELLFNDAAAWQAAQPLLGDAAHRVTPSFIPTNDSWLRDCGPTFLDGAGIDWNYNAWGKKYACDLDRAVAAAILQSRQRARIPAPLTLEGGAIEGNGQGWLMTTRSCVLSENRNPGMTESHAERMFASLLDTRAVVWLSGDGLAGDDTDGHIDQLARFVSVDTVVAAAPSAARSESWDINTAALERNLLDLAEWRSGDAKLQVVPLPIPVRRWRQCRRLPCSYCNFIFVNGAVIVPTFQDPADDRALGVLRDLFPRREVIGVDALELIWGLGAFHCLTQQEPQRPADLTASVN